MGQKAGIKITAMPEAEVLIDDREVGNTPYENDNLVAGEYRVRLLSGQSSWQGWVKLTKGAISVVNRELAPSIASSSGETLILEPGKGVITLSSPQEAEVDIDGKIQGKTPFTVAELTPGEHTFLFSKEGYLKRSIKAYVPEKMSLVLNVDLAMTEADLSTTSAPSSTPAPVQESTGIVKQTPNGYLRVRKTPSLRGEEITRISSGDKLVILEEKTGWMKVRLDDGAEGYVSSVYISR